MKTFTISLLLLILLVGPALSQRLKPVEPGRRGIEVVISPHVSKPSSIDFSSYKSPKRSGHYTAKDWRALIDSLWGPGLPTSMKLEIFDTFWNRVDREFSGFPNLNVNWDSLRARYRPEIEAGVSRGRFSAIMSQLSVALMETHTGIQETGIDTVNGISVHNTYLPGVPVFWPTGWDAAGNFGAALTPLPDSSLLVYRAVPSHPLGLVPGDIVLGYDRIPWKTLYKEILAAELPMQEVFLSLRSRGSTPRSWTHGLLNSAGVNWGLFDTIDVVKYSTGDTLHLPTARLAGQDWKSIYATDQIPVPGVTMPDMKNGGQIASGVLENTSVGYIYIHNWQDYIGPYFVNALNDLVKVKKVSGLIIDSRYNFGGLLVFGSSYLDPLFNFNPVGSLRWREAWRLDPADHLSFSYHQPWDSAQTVQPDYYDRPIAFLTGPHAWSAGDLTAFKMRFHPMARLFGLPTSGTFPGSLKPVWASDQEKARWKTWDYLLEVSQMQSLVNNEGLLMHKGFPVDEEVWLTREGAAKGEDDVVKRALAWMAGLSYAHDVKVSKNVVSLTGDSVVVTARVENPGHHSLAVSAIIGDANGMPTDSVLLVDDGHHGDGAAGDSIWGATIKTPPGEGFFGIAVRTDDKTQGTFRRLPDARLVTSLGPVVIAGYTVTSTDTVAGPGKILRYRITLKNLGSTVTLKNITAKVSSPDSTVTISNTQLTYGDLAPGQSSSGTAIQSVFFASSRPGNYAVLFSVEISTNGLPAWNDTFADLVTGIDDPEVALPKEFALEQNYPNPFNPTTTIRYAIAGVVAPSGASLSGVEGRVNNVRLVVYDLLGREVATLVNGVEEPGYKSVQWNAAGVASGVYYYQLRAGTFVQTKKLLLVR